MIPAKFDYIKASSLGEALTLLQEHGDEAKILSGGHSLIPSMKLRLATPSVLIDIGGISEMNTITEEGDEIVIGANCTHHQIATSDLVREHVNILSQAALCIGDIQVRNRGTLGGSLAHADPASDYPATVLACEATIVAEGKDGKRTIGANDFFQALFLTALQDDEIITAIRFPKVSQGTYQKFFQSASRFAVVGVAAIKKGDGVQIGVTGVSGVPFRATAVENAYDGTSSAAKHAMDGVDDIISDHFADEEYRSHLARVYVKRALEAL
ncbi:xanthine dehydrogenase family protein subunit M [Flavobacteriaceae bacterium TP-CH-4]|uniref:Xanthine dehydrogenase family protein subunit M n=1 Tax=Pelagihabitans pacificus TaxID=2696054 RepID=A0A967AU82_9FLAO|nr:xanthine dehydrogenase family protein subunit M [Pelagihabitans pacificus]NHF59480.1 xanthine dehydrogenase family protein subunit M [Pelagihabitans pacificus]